MNQQILNEGIKHLVSVEPNFKRFVPDHQIEFFLRPDGFKGICALVIEPVSYTHLTLPTITGV